MCLSPVIMGVIHCISGQNFSMGQIEELCGNPASIGSPEKIQNIIMFLYRSEGLAKHVDSFMQMLSLMDPSERTPLILAPLLSNNLQEARSLGYLSFILR